MAPRIRIHPQNVMDPEHCLHHGCESGSGRIQKFFNWSYKSDPSRDLIFLTILYNRHLINLINWSGSKSLLVPYALGSVADPDPPEPHVFGPPGSGSFYHHAKIVRKTLIPTILWLLCMVPYLQKVISQCCGFRIRIRICMDPH